LKLLLIPKKLKKYLVQKFFVFFEEKTVVGKGEEREEKTKEKVGVQ
jgi:hypothetical protein